MNENKYKSSWKIAALMGALFTFSSAAFSEVLEEIVRQSILSHPDMAISVQKFNAAKTDVDSSIAGFLPKLELNADIGKEDLDRQGLAETNKNRQRAQLKLTVPLFHGFSNISEYNRADYSAQASYYESRAQAESLALSITKAYIDTLSAQDIVVLSHENLEKHKKTFDLVNARKKQGVADNADLSQMKGRLAKANANLLSARNNLRDAKTQYIQITGLIPEHLQRPQVNTDYLPDSEKRTVELALIKNQAVVASQYGVRSAIESAKGGRSHFYPDFDLVLDKTWKKDVSGFTGEEDEWRILLAMNWKLYSGGSQHASQKKAAINQEQSRMKSNRVLREVKANAQSSWDAYKTLKEQIIYYQEYVEQTKESQKLYAAQFNVGRRTLLDLLDAQNELFQARKDYVATDYSYLYAQYRVINSMNYILESMNIDVMGDLSNE